MTKPVLHYIHACPFCQRAEIVLDLKGQRAAVDLAAVDITVPRPPALLALTRGSTSLPVLVTAEGVLKESLVIMRYLDAALAGPAIAREAPYERAVEEMLIALAGYFTAAGYRLIKNRDESQRESLRAAMLEQYRLLEDFLAWQNPGGVFLFERFGLAEAVFTPMFMRFWFLDYYEGFELPAEGFERVRRWRAPRPRASGGAAGQPRGNPQALLRLRRWHRQRRPAPGTRQVELRAGAALAAAPVAAAGQIFPHRLRCRTRARLDAFSGNVRSGLPVRKRGRPETLERFSACLRR